jgi:hypothetical protein
MATLFLQSFKNQFKTIFDIQSSNGFMFAKFAPLYRASKLNL